jgi:hypothetical protein
LLTGHGKFETSQDCYWPFLSNLAFLSDLILEYSEKKT